MKSIIPPVPDKPRGKAVSVPELAEILDLTPPRIRELITEGMPVFERGGKGVSHVLSSADCIYWYLEKGKIIKKNKGEDISPENDPKQRISETRAQMVELQLAEKRGDLFHFSDWLPFIKDKLVVFRQAMQTITENTRDRYGNETAKFIDQQTTAAVNALSQSLAVIPNEVKE